MEFFEVTSPTRIDLAGGTLDCWPLYNMVSPHCVTINFSLGVMSRVKLEPLSSQEIKVSIRDLNYHRDFKDQKEFLQDSDKPLGILQGMVEFLRPTQGFALTTQSQSPVGGGLGGSSSMTISLLKAFGRFLGRSWSVLEMVEIAHNLEARFIHALTGTQDYIPAIESGLYFIHYTVEGISIEKSPLPKEIFTRHMSLVYTGIPHQSGLNNWQVIKSVIEEKNEATLSSLRQINDIAFLMKETIELKHWEKLPQLFNQEYRSRVKLSSAFSSPRIDELKNLVLDSGAQAVKICGAGGGGCVMVWSPEEKKKEVEAKCLKTGFQLLPLNLHLL